MADKVPTPWIWDPIRRSYYIWKPREQLYEYQDGTLVNRAGQTVHVPRRGASELSVHSQLAAAGSASQVADAMSSMNLNSMSPGTYLTD
jgi:hypothetical protein